MGLPFFGDLGFFKAGLELDFGLGLVNIFHHIYETFSENIHPRKTETLMSTRSTRKIKTSINIFSILQLQITRVNISQADTEALFTDGIKDNEFTF